MGLLTGIVGLFNDVCDYFRSSDGFIPSVARCAVDVVSLPGTIANTLISGTFETAFKATCFFAGDDWKTASDRYERFTSGVGNKVRKVGSWVDSHTFPGFSEFVGNAVTIASTVTGVKTGMRITNDLYVKKKVIDRRKWELFHKENKREFNKKMRKERIKVKRQKKEIEEKIKNENRPVEYRDESYALDLSYIKWRYDQMKLESSMNNKWKQLGQSHYRGIKNACKNWTFNVKSEGYNVYTKVYQHNPSVKNSLYLYICIRNIWCI